MIPNSHCESATGPDITSLELEITRKCPLACTYCYRSLRDPANTDRETSMSLETATRAIEWALGRLPLRTRNLGVWFMGGEPLVEFALIKRLVEYGESRAADLGKTITFGATTNLVLIDEEIISFWREHRMKWNTSTDGAPASHDACRVFPDGRGSADAVRRKIPLVLEHWPNTTARATVTPQSAARILENARYLLDLGYTNIVMVASTDQAWPNDGLATLAGSFSDIGDFFIERFRRGQPFRLKWFDSAVKGIVKPQRGTGPCGAGRGMVCVDVHGEIWPCHRFPGYDPEGFWRLGSVDEGLDEEKRLPLLGFDCRRDVRGPCERCLAVHSCSVSCIAVNWFLNRDIHKPVRDYCRIREAAFREALRVHYVLRHENNAAFMNMYYGNGRSGHARVPVDPVLPAPRNSALPRLSCGAV